MSDNNKSQKPPEKKAIHTLLVIGALVFVQIPQVVSAWIDIAQWSLLLWRRDPAPTRTMPELTRPKAPDVCDRPGGASSIQNRKSKIQNVAFLK